MSNRTTLILCLAAMSQGLWSQTKGADMEYAFRKAQEYHHTNKDSTYHYYEKTISLADAKSDLDHLFMGLSYLINANGYYYDLPQYKKNIERLEGILKNDKRVDNFEWADYYSNYILFDKGNYHYKTKEYAIAKKHFLELYKGIEASASEGLSLGNIEMLSSINSFLGLINYHTGRYEQAEYAYRRDIELVTKHADSLNYWQSTVINSKKLLSQVYEVQNRQAEANELLQDALDYYALKVKDPRYKNNYLSTLMLLAKNFSKQGKYRKTLDLLNQPTDASLGNNLFNREFNLVKGDAYLRLDENEEALEQYKNGLSAYLEYHQNRPHQDVAMAYGKIARFYLVQGSYDDGIQHLIQALNNAGNDIQVRSIQENPKPQNVFSKRQLLHLLDLKLQLLQSAYSDTKNETYLSALITTNHSILNTFNLLKKEFESKLDKQFLAETAYPVFHRMLAVTHTAYERNPSLELLTLALNIAEKNKDFLLMEALRNTRATTYGGIPKVVLGKEAQLRAEITQLEKNIFDTSGKDPHLSGMLFKRKEEYYAFLDILKLKYPKYHNLKYQNENIDIATIRSKLIEDKEVMISFTLTDENLYAIVFDKTQEDFIKLGFNENDRKEVREFHKLISSPSIKTVKKNTVLANSLYDKILKKTLQGFEGQNLTIVPDDVLHYLPFDILQNNDSYLINDKTISYVNSVSSLLELKKKKAPTTKGLLAFAPSFDGVVPKNDERKFGKLLYNTTEANTISSIYDAQVYSQENATLQNFIEQAPNFRNIHLATHASANDEFPDFSYLAFSENGDNSHILYIKDLYNTSLNADMVTLSACQTGIGKLQKGQGMMSLSKGFYYAGAKSLVNTLWKINDKSTVKLMEYFYEGLSEGKSKKEALRNAKLKYLETTDDNLLKHPYYWAAFVVSGNADPINNPISPWWWLLTIPVLVMATYYMKRKMSA